MKTVKPNPMFEHFDDHPSARPTLSHMARAVLATGVIVIAIYVIAAWVAKLF